MSKITVTTIAGATSGSDANKVKIESGDDLIVESGGIGIGTSTVSTAIGGGVEIHRANGSSFRIEDTTNSVTGELQVYSNGVNLVAQTNHPIIVSPNNAEIARFTTAGLHLGGTGAANALDDYEEGSFTPTPVITHQPGGVSISNITQQVGKYVKIGSMVFFHIRIRFDKSGGSGNIGINGMPFAANADAANGNVGMAREGATEGTAYQFENIPSGTTQIGVIRKYDNGSLGTGTKDIQGHGFYRTDS